MTTAEGPLLKAVSTCRVCRATLDIHDPLFHMPRVPLAGAYLRPGASEQRRSEVAGPLSLTTCESCGLTQLLQSLDGRFYRDYSFAGGGGGAYRDYLHALASDLAAQFEQGAFVLEVGSVQPR